MSFKFLELRIILINLLFIRHYQLKNYSQELTYSSHRECKNYGRSHLDKIYSEYLNQYRQFEEIQLQKFLPDFQNDLEDQIYDRNLILENSQCNEHKRNRTLLNQQSLCPWKLTVFYRKDKYPHYISIAKCTCQTCTSKSNLFFECVPVFKTVPVLERSICNPNGFFEWKKEIERMTIACVCAFRYKFMPHRS